MYDSNPDFYTMEKKRLFCLIRFYIYETICLLFDMTDEGWIPFSIPFLTFQNHKKVVFVLFYEVYWQKALKVLVKINLAYSAQLNLLS